MFTIDLMTLYVTSITFKVLWENNNHPLYSTAHQLYMKIRIVIFFFSGVGSTEEARVIRRHLDPTTT